MSDMRDVNWHGVGGSASHRPTGLMRAHCSACGWCYREDWCPCCREAIGQVRVWIDTQEMQMQLINLTDRGLDQQGIGLEDRGMILMAVSHGVLGLTGVQDAEDT